MGKTGEIYTKALNKALEIFISENEEDISGVLSNGLQPIAEAAGLDRVIVYCLFNNRFGQVYRWVKDEGGTSELDAELKILPRHPAILKWTEVCSKGGTVNIHESNMSPDEASFLVPFGVKSMFLAPVLIKGKLWGAAAFQDHEQERVFDDETAEFLVSSARICANAFIRAEMKRDIVAEKDLTRELIDSASIGLVIFDENLKIIDCNNAVVNLFGGDTKQHYIENFYNYSPEHQPDGSVSFEKAESFLRHALDGERIVFEWMHQSVEGELIPCEVTLTRINYNNNFRVLGYLYDLRNIKKMEKTAAEAELTQTLIDSMPLSCILLDRECNVVTCNDETLRFFGITDKEKVIKGFFNYSEECQPNGRPSREMAFENIEKAFAEGINRFEWMHKHSNGESLPSEVILVRLLHKGEYLAAGYMRDLREHKAYVEEIENAYEILRLARNTAEAANKTKSVFLANMSHEMRTPMNVIVGLTDLMLEEKTTTGKIKETLRKINTAGNTLMGLINDVLDISKIEAGKLELMPVQYDIASLLNDIITLNLIRIEEKPIVFDLDINENIPASLFGDDLRIKQILNNLLSNAFKYTKKGTITLGVSCMHETENVWLNIYVKDTGIGIRKEDLAKLFTDYNQVDTKANRAIVGTGLGLSITKKFVELMDGEITVESEYGSGSTFSVKIRQGFVNNIPIGKETVENLSSFRYSNKKKLINEKLVRPDLSYARVLLVDDLPTNLDVAAGMLRKYKMQVDCVDNGEGAIDRISTGKPVYDAIFMDHMMPGLDGIQSTIVIRTLQTDYAKNIPIIALTANAIAGNEQMFLENGFNAFLPKPFNAMLLDSVVQRWVRDRSKE